MTTEQLDRRVEKGKLTRAAILSAALKLLSEGGEKALTASNLAKEVKISKATLFHHFKTIEDIPYAVAEDLVSQFARGRESLPHETVGDYVFFLGKAMIEAPAEKARLASAFLHYYLRALHQERYRLVQRTILLNFVAQLEFDFEKILDRPLSPSQKNTIPLIVSMCVEGMGLYFNVIKDYDRFIEAWRTFSNLINKMIEEKEYPYGKTEMRISETRFEAHIDGGN